MVAGTRSLNATTGHEAFVHLSLGKLTNPCRPSHSREEVRSVVLVATASSIVTGCLMDGGFSLRLQRHHRLRRSTWTMTVGIRRLPPSTFKCQPPLNASRAQSQFVGTTWNHLEPPNSLSPLYESIWLRLFFRTLKTCSQRPKMTLFQEIPSIS